MDEPRRRHMDHQSPEWVGPDASYFITVCAAPRGKNHFCHTTVGAAVLDSIGYRHEKGIWFCDLAVLMPDHIHLILGFPDVASFSEIIGDWKRWLKTKHRIVWQENFFDHRMRSEIDRNKGDYILQNPVRAGFVTRPEDWPWVWQPK